MKIPPFNARAALSLTELLLAIVIVAVLSSLFFTASKHVTTRSRDLRCVKTMKMLANAIFLYQSDHQQRLPPNKTDNPGITSENIWTLPLAPYLNLPVSTPAQTALRLEPHLSCAASPPSTAVWSWWYSHYGVNAFGPDTFGFDGISRRPSLQAPSRTMMLMETANMVRALRPTNSLLTNTAFRHEDRANVVFFDGHAESVTHATLPLSGLDTFWSGN